MPIKPPPMTVMRDGLMLSTYCFSRSISTTLRSAGASAVIYGGVDKIGIEFENIEKTLAIPQTDIRLFGKPEAFVKRRMGVALAYADTTESARNNAKKAAGLVKPQNR